MSTMRNMTMLPNETAIRAAIVKDLLDILDVRFLVYCLILPLALLGIILNGFTMLVLLHPRMRSFSTNAYLTTLSFANIGCLVSFLFMHSLRYLLSYDSFRLGIISSSADVTSYENFINLVYGIWTPLLATFQLFAIYLTCAVTVDRWIYVTWPLKADKICTMRNTFIAILALLIFCLVYNLPRWFEIQAIQKISPNTNKTYYQATLTDFAKHPVYSLIMQRYAYFIFVYGLPFFILIIANICIALKLIEAKRRKKRLLGNNTSSSSTMSKSMHSTIRNGSAQKSLLAANQNETTTSADVNNNQIQMESVVNKSSNVKSNNNASSSTLTKSQSNLNSVAINRRSNGRKLDTRVTAMVIAVVVVFFLCQFPYLIVNILAYKYSKNKYFQFSKAACDFLAVLNCCLNFIIYCLFGQKFREIAKNILLHPTMNPYSIKLSHHSMHSQFQSRTEQKSMFRSNAKSTVNCDETI